jgi:hypothetical protein
MPRDIRNGINCGKREEYGKEDVIGKRVFITEEGVSEGKAWLIVWFIMCAILSAIAFYFGIDTYIGYEKVVIGGNTYYEDIYGTEWSMVGLGILMAICAVAPLIYILPGMIRRRRNNSSKYPTIAVRHDGVFILYNTSGRKTHLEDRIQDVSSSGNTITFILEAPSGARYTKKADNVENAPATVTRIKNVLSYRDDRYVLTNFEKARLFCEYCGTRVSLTDKRCPHCGGKNTF